MYISSRIEWNRETRRMEVITEYVPGEPPEEPEAPRRPVNLGACLVVTAAVATTVPTSAWSATTTSIYQQASDAGRSHIDGSGVRVFHYDGGINPLSFNGPGVVDSQGDYPDMSAYKNNVYKVDGNYVGLYDSASDPGGIGYGALARKNNHGPWMNYTLLQQAPGVTLLTGWTSNWAQTFAVASDPNGYHARVMSASELVWYGSLQPSEIAALDKVVANDGLLLLAAGNDPSWASTVPVGMSPSYDIKYFGHVIPVTGTNQYTGDFSTNLTSCHGAKYYCVAAPQGTLQRDADGNPIRSANGRYLYSNGAGTSWSAPNANGVTAEVVQRYPWMTARNLTEVILGTADPRGTDNIDENTGWGEVNRDAAIGGYKQFAWGQSKLVIPAGQVAYFDNDIGDERADAVTTGIYNNDAATLGNVSTTLAGGFDKSGDGTLVLNGDNTYHGRGNVLGGMVVVNGRNDNAAFAVSKSAILQSGDNTAGMSVGSLDNAGTLALRHVGTTFDVMGDYTGHDLSLLLINTYLGDDTTTRTPVLHVHGNTTGTSIVAIANAGGPGGLIAGTPSSQDGHLLAQVDGTSGGEFVQEGRVVAGAYDYFVRRGTTHGVAASKNWYLSSTLTPVPTTPVTPPATPDPGAGSTPDVPAVPTPPGDTATPPPVVVTPATPPVSPTDAPQPPEINAIRPEGNVYLAQSVAARSMFQEGRWLGNRLVGAMPEDWDMRGSVWMTNQHSDRRYEASADGGTIAAQDNVVQAGAGAMVGDHLAIGARVGFGDTHTSTRSPLTGFHATGRTRGTQLGVYADYRQKPQGLSGFSATAELSGARYRNEVHGQGLPSESYRLTSTDLTVEGGYDSRWPMGGDKAIVFRPHLAAVQSRLQREQHVEAGATRVRFDSRPNTQLLAGLQVAGDLRQIGDTHWMPYAGYDRIHNNHSPRIAMDDTSLSTRAMRNVSRYTVGAEARFLNGLHLRLDVRHEHSGKGLNDNVAQASLALAF
ncbi:MULTISPECIES: autotransporter outer membrane beta-barrel domain-containing protein [Luteibacter]|uniref:autotransporter outer membrane beta-barrel domain-containing protein n=1 Tax=Luteibacter TaxID=242605 RepID=UPI00055F6F5C|nr:MULTISPECIES: autotransporter outer membrane beta-barrel domain-containing protein [unclassified Luteibacter]